MSTLLKALNKAQQDRREKLQGSAAAAAPTQLSLPVDGEQQAAHGPDAIRPRINPQLIPAPVAPPRADFSGAAILLAASAVITIAVNLLYQPAPPAMASASAKLTLDTVTIPDALLGAGPAPLKLRLDRRAARLPARNSNAATASRQ